MRVLGLDPGMLRLGWGVVEYADGIDCHHCGLLTNPPDPELTFNENLNESIGQIATNFPRLIDLYEPTHVAAEIVPVGRLGNRTELVVAAITVCKTVCFQFGLPWIDLGANTVKKQVTGDGRASKARVKKAVMEYFPGLAVRDKEEKEKQKREGRKRPPGIPPDVYDGIAVALAAIRKELDGTDSIRAETSDSAGTL